MANGEIGLLLRILEEAYSKRSWHGTNLRGSLRGLTKEEASWRPAKGRHNIWELMLHAAYWKYAVHRRLTGSERGSFPLEGSNWFVRPDGGAEADWKRELKLLGDEHRKLIAAVSALSSADLALRPGGSRNDNATVIYGVAAHDLYHAGQIQLIKRLLPGRV
ncbi:MAG TPA: DinB family protein [Thermoanaerobaculia bacterium]|nr:DinB family protein [Thermoanaerobaculia bacterium]